MIVPFRRPPRKRRNPWKPRRPRNLWRQVYFALLLVGLLWLLVDGGLNRLAPAWLGFARVIDGDTLDADGRRYRILGIDAPEIDQTCTLEGESVSCGQMARDAMEDIVSNSQITCKGQGRDKYDRTLAVCYVGGVDIGEELVRQGLAISDTYTSAQNEAQENTLGLWSMEFDDPADWRRDHE